MTTHTTTKEDIAFIRRHLEWVDQELNGTVFKGAYADNTASIEALDRLDKVINGQN